MSADARERQFSDLEVSRILKVAAELQERGEVPAAVGRLSINQLEQIATEVGMDPSVIQRAVEQVDGRAQVTRENAWLGGPQELIFEREVNGQPGPLAAEHIVDALHRATGELGDVSHVGRRLGWRGRLGHAKAEVSVAPTGERTSIRLRVMLGGLMERSYGIGVAVGVGAAFVTFGSSMNALGAMAGPLAAAVAGAVMLVARGHYARSVAAYRDRAAELVDAVATTLSIPADGRLNEPPAARSAKDDAARDTPRR